MRSLRTHSEILNLPSHLEQISPKQQSCKHRKLSTVHVREQNFKNKKNPDQKHFYNFELNRRKTSGPLCCYHRFQDTQQCDMETVPLGTTPIPNFILMRPVVLELKYRDRRTDFTSPLRVPPMQFVQRNAPPFTAHEGSLPRWHEPATYDYPQPHESKPIRNKMDVEMQLIDCMQLRCASQHITCN